MVITLLLCVAVFLSAAAGDIVEAYMVRSIVDKDPHKAARMSITMWAIGCISWIIIVKSDQWYIYLVPEVMGLYLGSFIGVSLQRRSKPRHKQLRIRACARAQTALPARLQPASPTGGRTADHMLN